jgi:hypothetical protein
MAKDIGPDPAVRDLSAEDPVRASRTGELGSEGGGYGELTQAARAARGDNAEVKPFGSLSLTIAATATVILLVLLVVWFASSLPEWMG